jgi:hypothetical protein
MSASSVNRKVAEVVKAEKVERRHAIEKRNQPKNNKPEREEVEIRGLSAETSRSDIPVASEEVKRVVSAWRKETKKKSISKKKSTKKS